MATLADLVVRLGADTEELEGAFGRAAKAVDDHLMAIGVTAATAGATLEGFSRSQQDVNTSMERTSVATGLASDELRDMAVEMSDGSGSASDIAGAMEQLSQSGYGTRDEFEAILPVMSDFSDATGKDLSESIDHAESLLGPFGQGLDDVGDNVDQMSRLVQQTGVPLGSLERNLARVPEELQALEFGLDDAAAGIDVFEDKGFTGKEAVREFRRAVADSEGDMDAFLESIGLTAEEWEEYQEAAMPAADLTDDLAGVANDAKTPMQNLQDTIEDLKFEYGFLADAAGVLALPMIALGPVIKGLITTVGFLGTQLFSPTSGFRRMAASAGTAAKRVAVASASFVGSAARMVASMATTAARVVAGWVMMGVQAMIQGARMAAAWLLSIWPIALIVAAVVAIVALIIIYWDEIVEAVSSAWEWVKEATSTAWEWIVEFLTGLWDSIVELFWNAVDWVSEAVSSGLDWLIDMFMSWHPLGIIISHWDDIVDAFNNGIEWAKGIVDSGIEAVLGFLRNLAKIPGMVGGFFSDMASAAASRISSFLSTVAGIPGRVTSAIGNLGSLLLNAGKDIIRGLINGVKNMIGSLRSTFSRITNMIPDWKGPMRVDQRILGPSGEALMAGLSDGVMDGLPGLRSVLRGVTDEIPHNVRASVRSSGGSSNRVELDVTGADGEMKRLIRKMVKTDGRGSVQNAFGGK